MTPLERYVAFFEAVPTASFENLDSVVTEDVRFVDPFNDILGQEAFRRILHDMREQIADLEIVVTDSAMIPGRGDTPGSDEPATALLRWNISGKLVAFGGREWRVTGCSAIRFASDGRVEEHIDYWDAAGQLYEYVPVLGAILRAVRRRLSIRNRR